MVNRHKIIFLLLVATLISGASAFAQEETEERAVLQGEVVSYYEPPVPEETGWWSRLRRYLSARSRIQRPPIGTKLVVQASAYASSPRQTDSTPCTTAAGTRVRPGVIATNMLPFGTIVDINGELYIVEDRMNSRYQKHVDIWFTSTAQALQFGRQRITLTVVGYGTPGQTLERKPEDGTIEEASLIRRVSLRFMAVSRQVSQVLPANVNRFDVDCLNNPNQK